MTLRSGSMLGGLLLLLLCIYSAEASNQKPKVRSVVLEGNTAFSSERLVGLILTRPSRFLATCRYHPELFSDDLDNLTSFYKQNGYLEARIVDTTVQLDSIARAVDVTIVIDEGARTHVEGVTIFGNKFFPDSTLRPYVAIEKGEPLRRPVIEDAVAAMLSLYAEQGFLDASVTPEVRIDSLAHVAVVDFLIQEDAQAYIATVRTAGAQKTKEYVIMRELDFQVGDTVMYSRLLRSQRRLYLTGLFGSVFVRPVPSASGDPAQKDILIEIKEKPSGELSLSIGYGSIEKIRGKIELSTFSLAGTARKLGATIQANFIKQGISTSFSEPWTFGTRWKTDLSLFGELRQEPGFHAEALGGRLTVGRKIGLYTTASLSYRFENTNLSRVDVEARIQELDPRIRSLTLSITHDTRDNLFDPISGWYESWANEVAGSFLQGSNTFVRSVAILKHFRPLSSRANVASGLEFGWMKSFGNGEETPLSERFYTGGPTSLRGFGYQMVGPVDVTGEPLGGEVKLVWNILEIRYAIYKLFGCALFVDAGNVWSGPDDVRLDDLRIDAGLGIRANTPLGITRLDYGVNLDRRRNEPRAKWFLGMGQAF